jgi:hypothetical protein
MADSLFNIMGPSALTVNAIEIADFSFSWQKVYSE